MPVSHGLNGMRQGRMKPIRNIWCAMPDEGDRRFHGRSILEGDPHSLLEGMIIGARHRCIGRGYLRRAEYPRCHFSPGDCHGASQRKRLLGKNILGSGFLSIFASKPAPGLSSAVKRPPSLRLLKAKEGPGLSRLSRHRKASGSKPNINNVETFANVPFIIANGGEAFAALGTEKSKGTKVFALASKIKKAVVKIPNGTSIRTLSRNRRRH